MNRQDQPETTDGREIARVGQDEFDVWPVWCTRVKRSCRQCIFEGKLLCHPRFRRTKEPPTKRMEVTRLLKDGKPAMEVHRATGVPVSTIYSIAQNLRDKGELASTRGHHSAETKEEIVSYARAHPDTEYTDIAEKFGVRRTLVTRLCLAAGIKKRKRLQGEVKRKTATAVEILRKDPNRSMESIAVELGLNAVTLERYLKGMLLPQGRLLLEVLREEIAAGVREAFNKYCCPWCGRSRERDYLPTASEVRRAKGIAEKLIKESTEKR